MRLAPIAVGLAAVLGTRAGYRQLVAGNLTVNLDIGRSTRPLGPLTLSIDAPRTVVWEVITAPYLGRSPAALRGEIEVLERGTDMVLAAHRTTVGRGLVATTVETVRFAAPDAVHFRLVRGPVPYAVETYRLHDHERSTRLEYDGELGGDLWAVGRWWAGQVARRWESAVQKSMAQIKEHAEQRASRHRARGQTTEST